MQAALINHERVKRSTELPLFYGVKGKDTVTAHQLIERIEKASRIANWDAERKTDELYMILRDQALLWWNSLENEEIPRITVDNWDELKKAFIAAYAPRYTARATCNIFVEMQQKPGESVQSYYLKVDDAFRKLCEAKPIDMTTTITAPLLPKADIPDDPGHLSLQQAMTYKQEGIAQDSKYFLHQLFVAGLNEELRTKVMEGGKQNIKESLSMARDLETILKDKRGKSYNVSKVQQENKEGDEEDLQDEDEKVEALYRKDNRYQKKGNLQKKSPGFKGNCRFCKKFGHSQKFCRLRKSKGAPMVDQNGKPFNVKEIAEENQDWDHPDWNPEQENVVSQIQHLNF